MNIAFSAVLVFILVLPGLLFRYTYQRGFFRRSPVTVPSFAEDLAFSVLWAGLLHTLWLNLFALFGLRLEYGPLLALLVGQFGRDQIYLDDAVLALQTAHAAITFYFLSLFAAGYGMGYAFHALVRRQRWDRTTRAFRFPNEWYYLFSGEEADVDEPNVYVTVLLELKEGTYLYRGILQAWYFDRQGSLERIVLEEVLRRRLSEDRDSSEPYLPPMRGTDERYYSVEGDLLVLRYNEIKTLNVEYLYLAPVA